MRPAPAAMMRLAGAYMLLMVLFGATAAAANGIALQRVHRGISLVALAPEPAKQFDTSLVSADRGLRRIAAAFDHLIENSPHAARAIDSLRDQGHVLLVYRPDDLRKTSRGESVAMFHPDYRRQPARYGSKKVFLVVVGRHGVKWPAKELAAVLAHELLGHGMQQARGRLAGIRVIDAECEANLYEEIANQDLGLDKRGRQMIAFRQALENHWCADFKAYLRRHRPGVMRIWNALNPDVPKLLAMFEDYLAHAARTGVTARAQAAADRQRRLARTDMLRDAGPQALFEAAVALRDGGIGVPPDPAEAYRYFRRAARKGHTKAIAELGWLRQAGLDIPPAGGAGAFSWFSRAVLPTTPEAAHVARPMPAADFAYDND